jgi:hypothetical protein
MKAELAAENTGKMSGKKKKRLDKYIVRLFLRFRSYRLLIFLPLGYQTQERRKPRPTQETRRAENRYESISQLD